MLGCHHIVSFTFLDHISEAVSLTTKMKSSIYLLMPLVLAASAAVTPGRRAKCRGHAYSQVSVSSSSAVSSSSSPSSSSSSSLVGTTCTQTSTTASTTTTTFTVTPDTTTSVSTVSTVYETTTDTTSATNPPDTITVTDTVFTTSTATETDTASETVTATTTTTVAPATKTLGAGYIPACSEYPARRRAVDPKRRDTNLISPGDIAPCTSTVSETPSAVAVTISKGEYEYVDYIIMIVAT